MFSNTSIQGGEGRSGGRGREERGRREGGEREGGREEGKERKRRGMSEERGRGEERVGQSGTEA